MPEPGAKAALLNTIQTGYSQFETLLAPLSEEQMSTPTDHQRHVVHQR